MATGSTGDVTVTVAVPQGGSPAAPGVPIVATPPAQAPPSGGPFAHTGLALISLLVVAALLILAGTALCRARRRIPPHQ